jgi:hypothetical protein
MKIKEIGKTESSVALRLMISVDDNVLKNGIKLPAGNYDYGCSNGKFKHWINKQEVIDNTTARLQEQEQIKLMSPSELAEYVKLPLVKQVHQMIDVNMFTEYFTNSNTFEENAQKFLEDQEGLVFSS